MNPNHAIRSVVAILIAVPFLTTTASTGSQRNKPDQKPRKLFMWEATSGSNVVYLIGSIHFGTQKLYPLPKVMDAAFGRSKVLVEEADFSKDEDPIIASVKTVGMFKDGDSLWNHVSERTANKVRKFCAKHHIPESDARYMRAWLVGFMVSEDAVEKSGFTSNEGIDFHFLKLAKGKKKIEGVETIAFQMSLATALPDDLSEAYLSWQFASHEDPRKYSKRFENMWLKGDAAAIDDGMTKSENSEPKRLVAWHHSMEKDRNLHMANVAEKYLKGNGPCFMVVGAAHLCGSKSVIAMLKSRGHKVVQLSVQ